MEHTGRIGGDCQCHPAAVVVATFFDTDLPTIRLERGDQTSMLWRVGAASAGRYAGRSVSLVHQAGALMLHRLDSRGGQADDWQCRAR